MGFACFEGTELTDFGVRSIRQGSLSIILLHIEEIVGRMLNERKPYAVAYEKNPFSVATHNYRLARAIQRIETVAKRHHVRAFPYDPRTVRKVVCGNGNVTKKELARCVAVRYRETVMYLKGRNATQERYWQNAFDAIGCGLAFLTMSRTFLPTDSSVRLVKSVGKR